MAGVRIPLPAAGRPDRAHAAGDQGAAGPADRQRRGRRLRAAPRRRRRAGADASPPRTWPPCGWTAICPRWSICCPSRPRSAGGCSRRSSAWSGAASELVHFNPRDLAACWTWTRKRRPRAARIELAQDFLLCPAVSRPGRADDPPRRALRGAGHRLPGGGTRKEAEYERLNRVVRFALSGQCRQQQILHYFGDTESGDCGHCDNCGRAGTAPRGKAAGGNGRRRRRGPAARSPTRTRCAWCGSCSAAWPAPRPVSAAARTSSPKCWPARDRRGSKNYGSTG